MKRQCSNAKLMAYILKIEKPKATDKNEYFFRHGLYIFDFLLERGTVSLDKKYNFLLK